MKKEKNTIKQNCRQKYIKKEFEMEKGWRGNEIRKITDDETFPKLIPSKAAHNLISKHQPNKLWRQHIFLK